MFCDLLFDFVWFDALRPSKQLRSCRDVTSNFVGLLPDIEMKWHLKPCMKHHPSKQLRLLWRGGLTITYYSSWAGLGLISGLPVHKCQVSVQLCVEVPCSPSISPSPDGRGPVLWSIYVEYELLFYYLLCTCFIAAWENLLYASANNKGADKLYISPDWLAPLFLLPKIKYLKPHV